MANLTFSPKEIEDLVRKVSALDQFLSKKERELLLAIFASAAERVTRNKAGRGVFPASGQGADSATLEDLQQQLLNAYIAGNEPPHGIAAKITGDTSGP
jgi:hypothetical protein